MLFDIHLQVEDTKYIEIALILRKYEGFSKKGQNLSGH